MWKPPGDHVAARYVAEKTAWRDRQMQEYRRLLYVGLTRAQDRLYICGWQTLRPPPQICWHTLCRAGLAECAQPFDFDAKPLIGEEDGWSGEGLRIESRRPRRPQREPASAAATATRRCRPTGRRRRRRPSPIRRGRCSRRGRAATSRRPCRRSRSAGATASSAGCWSTGCCRACRELPPAERDAAARRFLALPTHALAADEQDEIRRETLAVLSHPDFAPLFGPRLAGRGAARRARSAGHALSGQIDRLVVDADRVLIVDYKTMRPVPANEARGGARSICASWRSIARRWRGSIPAATSAAPCCGRKARC